MLHTRAALFLSAAAALLVGWGAPPAAVAKPTPPLTVALDLGPDLGPGAVTTATVTVTATAWLSGTVLAWAVEGASASGQALTLALGELRPGEPRHASLRLRLPGAGRAVVRAVVSATAPGGPGPVESSAAVYVIIDDEGVHVGGLGFSALERELLRARYAPDDPVLEHLLGAGATETAVGPTSDFAPRVRGRVRVHGQIRWTDLAGGIHPVPFVRVEIYDDDSPGPSSLVDSATTDVMGNYSVDVSNDEGLTGSGDADLFVRALARSGTTYVETLAPGADVYYVDSRVHTDVQPGDLPVTLTAATSGDNNKAFSIIHAVVEAELYVESLTGSLPPAVTVVFPDLATSRYNSVFNFIGLEADDAFDWDVIHHEYGHSMAHRANIQDSPDGLSHSAQQNLAELHGKSAGIRLAWGEGLATYLGNTIQVGRGLAGRTPPIPNTGDGSYLDISHVTGGSATVDYYLENDNLGDAVSMGEDAEATVARILFDLYDPANESNDRIALGDRALWRILTAFNPHTLSEAWNALVEAVPLATKLRYAAIFTDHGVAPDAVNPSDGDALTDEVVFRWRLGGGGPMFPLNRFFVEFYKPDLSGPRFISEPIAVPVPATEFAMWDPSPEQVAEIRSLLPLVWIVSGRNTAAPQTGEYVSRAFGLGGIRLGFVLDDTGSMGEEIGGVRGALTRFIASLASEPEPPGIAVVTFKDAPSLHVATNDLAAVQSAVDGLAAGGGDDCPEASAEALSLAARTARSGSVLFLSTDADPLPGSDITSVIAALRARRIRVEVLLSGSCTETAVAAARSAEAGPVALVEGGEDHGNTPADATSLVPDGTPLPGRIADGDRDVFRFAATAGTPYDVEVLADPGFDSFLSVYAPDGSTLLVTDDDSGVDLGSRLTFTPTETAPHFVEVKGFGASTGLYQLVVAAGGGAGGPLGAIQAFSRIASETGGVFVYLPGVNFDADEARRYESAALDIMSGAVRPSVPFVEPPTVPAGARLVLTVHGLGTSFSSATTVAFSAPGITVGPSVPISATELEVPIEVAPDATAGFTDVTVTTPLGARTEEATGHDSLRLTAPPSGPTIVGITPSRLGLGDTAGLRVFGINTHFDATSRLALGSGVTVSALTAASATELRATVTVADDPSIAGFHDVRVTTGSEVATEDVPGPLLLLRRLAADIPRLTDVSPAEGTPGAALTLSVTGENTHFADTSAAEFFPGGIRVVAIRATEPTAAELDVEIDADAALGARDLAIVTGGETASGLGLFAVRGTAVVADCTVASDCDDGEPCTENHCVDRRCQFPAVTGIETVRCAFARPLAPPECQGASIPRAVTNKFAAAGRLVERAAEATTANKTGKLLKKARRPLKASLRAVSKAENRRKRPLPAACATALREVLRFAQDRLAEFRL